jgi:hypothetical protein
MELPVMEQMNARAATKSDINLVHRELMDLIDSMPFYSDLFKQHEKARLDKTFLRTLLAIDPWHILLLEMNGEVGGFLISGPDCGTIFQFWSAIFPKFRKTPLGRFGMDAFIDHWDNGRFHKASTWVRPDNRPALALLRLLRAPRGLVQGGEPVTHAGRRRRQVPGQLGEPSPLHLRVPGVAQYPPVGGEVGGQRVQRPARRREAARVCQEQGAQAADGDPLAVHRVGGVAPHVVPRADDGAHLGADRGGEDIGRRPGHARCCLMWRPLAHVSTHPAGLVRHSDTCSAPPGTE